MRRERDQATISPRLALTKPIRGQAVAPLGLDFVHNGPTPIGAPLRRPEDAGIDALIAIGVVAYTGGRVEVDGLERPMKDQRNARPSRIPTSTSSTPAYPCS